MLVFHFYACIKLFSFVSPFLYSENFYLISHYDMTLLIFLQWSNFIITIFLESFTLRLFLPLFNMIQLSFFYYVRYLFSFFLLSTIVNTFYTRALRFDIFILFMLILSFNNVLFLSNDWVSNITFSIIVHNVAFVLLFISIFLHQSIWYCYSS